MINNSKAQENRFQKYRKFAIVYSIRMKFSHLFLLLILLNGFALGQINFKSEKLSKIIYEVSYNGQKDENQNPIWVVSDGTNFLISSKNALSQKSDFPVEMTFVNTTNKSFNPIAFLNPDETVGMLDTTSISEQTFEFTDQTKTILGHTCKMAKTIVNSNTIEIWYTDQIPMKASPNILGAELGLVLEIVRNGNFVTQAVKIEKNNFKLDESFAQAQVEMLKKMDYQDKIWRARFTHLEVFSNQQIHFSDEFEPKTGVMRFANGTVVVKKIRFPKLNSNAQIFVDLTEQSNGDAYDRTGSVFLIPTEKPVSFLDALQNGIEKLPVYENGNGKKYQGIAATKDYEPPVELMRFFTPFGVKHFNERVSLKNKNWQDSVYYRQEISDYGSLLSEKEVFIGVFIGNYDKGGHLVSLNVSIHQNEASEEALKKAIPLFNTLNIMEMAGQEYSTLFDSEKGLEVEFELKEDLKNAHLKYITTGHGGWGNGDEFLRKKNTVLLDERVVFDMIPWREDCGAYRLYNPVSGNFRNGLSSSDYSRSNWCPGTLTNAYLIDLGDLEAGKHKIKVQIPQGKPEGNSFSAWNVSGVLVGE
jgi:hypothetical protein